MLPDLDLEGLSNTVSSTKSSSAISCACLARLEVSAETSMSSRACGTFLMNSWGPREMWRGDLCREGGRGVADRGVRTVSGESWIGGEVARCLCLSGRCTRTGVEGEEREEEEEEEE